MRRSVILAAGLFLFGCRGKHEAETAEEFVQKYAKAARAGDFDTLWLMLSKESQNLYTESAKQLLESVKGNDAATKKLQEEYGLSQDPAKMPLPDFVKARWKKETKRDTESVASGAYVKESTEGDRVIAVVEGNSMGRAEWVLVREKKYLKYDVVKTAIRNRPR